MVAAGRIGRALMKKKMKAWRISWKRIMRNKKKKMMMILMINTNNKEGKIINSSIKREDLKRIRVRKNTRFVAKRYVKEEASMVVREQVVLFLPLDIVTNILSRLPVKSLLRVRRVCKQFHSLICTPDFIKEQHIRALSRPALISQLFCRQTIWFYDFDDDGEIKEYSFNIKSGELPMNAAMSLSNSVNGLVCVYPSRKFDSHGVHYLLNPSTRENVKLPNSNQEGPADSSMGLAFNVSTGEYKLVRLFRKKYNFCGCEVLSVGTREWRYVGDASCRLPTREPVFLNGSLHWVALCHRNTTSTIPVQAILAFDVKDEKLRLMPVPKEAVLIHSALVLTESGGHLYLWKQPAPCHPSILQDPRCRDPFLLTWMLKDYKRHEWAQEHEIDMSNYVKNHFRPYFIGSRGQNILFEVCPQMESVKVYSYDIHSKTFNELYSPVSNQLKLITESLVSPGTLVAGQSTAYVGACQEL